MKALRLERSLGEVRIDIDAASAVIWGVSTSDELCNLADGES